MQNHSSLIDVSILEQIIHRLEDHHRTLCVTTPATPSTVIPASIQANRRVSEWSRATRATRGSVTSVLANEASTAPKAATAGASLPVCASVAAEATALALETNPPAALTT